MMSELERFFEFALELEQTDQRLVEVKSAMMAFLDMGDQLWKLIGASPDKAATHATIQRAIEIGRGKHFVLTQHGIMESISGRYDRSKRAKVIERINRVFGLLRRSLDIDAYYTSGTLLGFVREGDFLGHDDDFDAAYISKEILAPNILLERLDIKKEIDASGNFAANECTGGHFKVLCRGDDFVFDFDLFTGWISNGKLSEYPLDPDILEYTELVPLSNIEAYGQRLAVPQHPNALLRLNYGINWRQPDPTFRFDWSKNREYYAFLTTHKIVDGQIPYSLKELRGALPALSREGKSDLGVVLAEAALITLALDTIGACPIPIVINIGIGKSEFLLATSDDIGFVETFDVASESVDDDFPLEARGMIASKQCILLLGKSAVHKLPHIITFLTSFSAHPQLVIIQSDFDRDTEVSNHVHAELWRLGAQSRVRLRYIGHRGSFVLFRVNFVFSSADGTGQ